MLLHSKVVSFLKISRKTCLFGEKWQKICFRNSDFF
ncbi:hypothetical protein T4A_1689 [Trichinella pseudospiralis]|uniref:Uncharacterized protein n=1 Tax=Trichinella pseudospiralis TaxID=6337 RepID=A0A0V1DLA5_TRIPS|nr:hypothetical protein T4A_1689 [Trichinella pseudospiralis]